MKSANSRKKKKDRKYLRRLADDWKSANKLIPESIGDDIKKAGNLFTFSMKCWLEVNCEVVIKQETSRWRQ